MYECKSRSNKVKVKNIEKLEKILSKYNINLEKDNNLECILYKDSGSILFAHNNEFKLDDFLFKNEIEDVLDCLEDNEILILIECGNDKLRYLNGLSYAFQKNKEELEISTDNIYELIREKWNTNDFTLAES